MKTSMRGPYTGPRGGVYYIDAKGNKQYGDDAVKARQRAAINLRAKEMQQRSRNSAILKNFAKYNLSRYGTIFAPQR